jgi:4-amino-4-deoxy-L-arabinose transferase-like glycosyltransferase
MEKSRTWREVVFSDLGILILLALAKLIFHILTNTQYGFHRDELQTLDDARNLAWGYVAYPPLAPFIARVALTLFGPSLDGLRMFAALAQSIAMVFAGLMARELGGKRFAQILTALAVAITPLSFAMSTLFEYTGLDYLWGVLLAYCIIRLLKSDDARWWLGIGAVIGVGLMTRYTMAFEAAGLVAGVMLTKSRRYLMSPWLWGGAALSIFIFLPNLIWQAQHGFISLQFLSAIHARDVQIGRSSDFLLDQLRVSTNPFVLPLWLAGLYFYLFSSNGKQYRLLGFMAPITWALFAVAQARGYYTGPLFPVLYAAGAVWFERWLATLAPSRVRLARGVTWGFVAVGGAIALSVGPYWPVNSAGWGFASSLNGDLKEEIGWQSLVQTVAGIYDNLPAADRSHTSILAGNYGVAGAIDLYGPAYQLPRVISAINSYWLQGYGAPPPQSLIVVGLPRATIDRFFSDCQVAGHVTNVYGVRNEETTEHPDIFICSGVRMPWPQLWVQFRSFG